MTGPTGVSHIDGAALDKRLAKSGIAQWSLDIATGAVIASAFCRSLLGWSDKDILDEGHLLAAIHPDDRALFIDAIAGCAERGDPFHLVHHALTGSGDEKRVETRGLAVLGADGVAVRIAAVTATHRSV